MHFGEMPTFKIWDGSTNHYYDAHLSSDDCLWENQGYCCSDQLMADNYGCTDVDSCNYDEDATVDDGSCKYLDCNGECDCLGADGVGSCNENSGGDGICQILDACDECDGDNPVDCHQDGAPCWLDNQCYSGNCDACGECGYQNPINCSEYGDDCYVDNDCRDDMLCDACGDCGGENPINCSEYGDDCSLDSDCRDAMPCDACGDCGDDNPIHCFEDGESCGFDSDCEALHCDACGECNGDNVECLENWESCENADQCSSDVCDECGHCGGDGPEEDYLCIDIPNGFEWNQSTSQSFYFIDMAYDSFGNELVPGQDWVGVFHNGLCVGSTIWTDGGVTIPAMGDDGTVFTEGYLENGDIPDFKIFTSEGVQSVYPYNYDDPYQTYENLNLEFINFGFIIFDILVPEYSNYNRIIKEGVNFVSFYVLPVDASIENVMHSVSCDDIGVMGEAEAAYYSTEINGWIGSLEEFEHGRGYNIVNGCESETISFVGFNYNPDAEYNLHAGSNFISFPAFGSYYIEDVIPDDLLFVDYAILGPGMAAIYYDDMWIGALTQLESGVGYWFQVGVPVSFQFNFNENLVRQKFINGEQLPDCDQFIVTQSDKQAFYFIGDIKLNNASIEHGDWILVYNGRVLSGIRQWNGEMVDVPAMGSSKYNNKTSGYFNDGDLPTFKLLKKTTKELFTLSGEVSTWSSNSISIIGSLSEVEPLPDTFMLDKIYPNPFNPATSIYFGIPTGSKVLVQIYNLQGQVVETLANNHMAAGYHALVWDAGDNSSGVYFVKMVAGDYVATQKLLLVK